MDDRSGQRKKWKVEVSAGGIVYKKEQGQIFVLLILKKPWRKDNEKDNEKEIWTLPKGWISDHPKETTQETAAREVREEAGVNAEVKEDLGEIKYFFKWEGENIFKIVHYFLMEYVSGDPKDHDYEVKDAKWFGLSEVREKLTYKTDKEVFEKAKEILLKHGKTQD